MANRSQCQKPHKAEQAEIDVEIGALSRISTTKPVKQRVTSYASKKPRKIAVGYVAQVSRSFFSGIYRQNNRIF